MYAEIDISLDRQTKTVCKHLRSHTMISSISLSHYASVFDVKLKDFVKGWRLKQCLKDCL